MPFLARFLRLAALSSACVLACACGPLPRAARPAGGLPITERVKVIWKGEPAPGLRAELERFINEAELVYRARFGGGDLPVRGLVFEPGYLLALPGSRRPVRAYVQGGVIHLPYGGFWPGSEIIHELHHLGSGSSRPTHKGSGWRAANHLGRRWWAEFWELP